MSAGRTCLDQRNATKIGPIMDCQHCSLPETHALKGIICVIWYNLHADGKPKGGTSSLVFGSRLSARLRACSDNDAEREGERKRERKREREDGLLMFIVALTDRAQKGQNYAELHFWTIVS